MVTTTLFKIIQSELIKQGFDEFLDKDGNLILFNDDMQFMTKILNYDNDVSDIVDRLFNGLSLQQQEYDDHFKKTFIYRFLNRQINRQTIDSFKVELMGTFLVNQSFINSVYTDLDKYVTQAQTNESETTQQNEQLNDGTTTSDNRSAFAELPQKNVQLDVDSTIMTTANDNTISRNKQRNNQTTSGETFNESFSESKQYQLDELIKSSTLFQEILNIFDVKCFLQFW